MAQQATQPAAVRFINPSDLGDTLFELRRRNHLKKDVTDDEALGCMREAIKKWEKANAGSSCALAIYYALKDARHLAFDS